MPCEDSVLLHLYSRGSKVSSDSSSTIEMNHLAKKDDVKGSTISKNDLKKKMLTKIEPTMSFISKIQGFLQQQEINNEVVDEQSLIVPYEIDGKLFKPTVSLNDKWIVVSSLIVKGEDLPNDKNNDYKFDLFRKLLLAIHELPEINYDIDDQDNIYVSADMRYDITDVDNFFSEFLAVPFGIKYFVEHIANSMDPPIDVKGFG